MSKGNIFSKSTWRCFFKIKHIFEENLYFPLFRSNVQSKFELHRNLSIDCFWELVSICYNFSLKGVSEQTLITATVIKFRIMLGVDDLKSTNKGY